MKNKHIFIIVGVLCTLAMIIILASYRQEKSRKVVINWNAPAYIHKRNNRIYSTFKKNKLDDPLPTDTVEEIAEKEEKQKEEFKKIRTPEQIIDEFGIYFNSQDSELAVEVNTKIYDVVESYFLTAYNGKQLSPFIPMAIANVETPHRVNPKINYSALLPSKYISVVSSDAVDTMSSLAVLDSPEVFRALASDHWSRDRGPLQQMDMAGTMYESYNSLMGPSEQSLLRNYTGMDKDFSAYQAYEPRTGRTLSVKDWVDEASSMPGDRHNIRDAVLRASAEFQQAIDQYSSQYEIENEYQAMVICSMYHAESSIWNPAYAHKSVGVWLKGGESAHSLLIGVTNSDFIKIIEDFVDQKIKDYRNGGELRIYCEREWASNLYQIGVDKGYFYDYPLYVNTSAQYHYVKYQYPIQALYAYIMLNKLYTGE